MKADIRLKIVSSLAKVFADEEPMEYLETGKYSGFKNEVISFQAAYTSEGMLWENFADIEIKSPIKNIIRVRKVELVPVGLATFFDADANYLRENPGMFPDLLTDLKDSPTGHIRTFSGQWRAIWIDVEPREQTKAGTYPIEILIKTLNGEVMAQRTVNVPANNHIDPFINAKVKGLWTYYCVAQYKDVSNLFIAMPSARNRIFGVQLYKYDIEGILQWGYNFYKSQYCGYNIDPYAVTDADGFAPAGDPFQVYPGKGGIPEESIRFMVTQQAIFDLRALKMLEGLTSKEYVMEIVEDSLAKPITFSVYPKTDAYIFALRDRVNREILKRIQ